MPIGAYVADFCCLAARLVVEVDGDQHGFETQAAYDARRTEAFVAQGFRILRFTNAEVMRDIDVVLDTIVAMVLEPGATLSPNSYSYPHRGGEHAAET